MEVFYRATFYLNPERVKIALNECFKIKRSPLIMQSLQYFNQKDQYFPCLPQFCIYVILYLFFRKKAPNLIQQTCQCQKYLYFFYR